MAKPGKDSILKELIDFFLDELSNDPLGVADYLIQGDFDPEEFIPAVAQLKRELTLRDCP